MVAARSIRSRVTPSKRPALKSEQRGKALATSLLSFLSICAACDKSGEAQQSIPTTATVTAKGAAPSNVPGVDSTGAASQLALNDISILWPVPKKTEDIGKLLNGTTPVRSGSSIWPLKEFERIVDATKSLKFKGPLGRDHSIVFPKPESLDLTDLSHWKVVGLRADPAAPSTHENPLGTIPQIRIVMQPVGEVNGKVHAYDYTAHIVYSFLANTERPFKPDKVAFQAIVSDLIELKQYLLKLDPAVETGGTLRTHPGLAASHAGFQAKVQQFLATHLSPKNLQLIAFSGVNFPGNDTWMFFELYPGETAPEPNIAAFPTNSAAPTIPTASNSNLEQNKTVLRQPGVSTRVLFSLMTPEKLELPAIPGRPSPLNKDIPDIIANPSYSNPINTDCVSCHTETTRRAHWKLALTSFAYRGDSESPIVSPSVLPVNVWNFRNFGWFTETILVPAQAFASTRTGNETANALSYLKSNYK